MDGAEPLMDGAERVLRANALVGRRDGLRYVREPDQAALGTA